MDAHKSDSIADSLARARAADWGREFGAIIRITRMAPRHPWQFAAAVAAIWSRRCSS